MVQWWPAPPKSNPCRGATSSPWRCSHRGSIFLAFCTPDRPYPFRSIQKRCSGPSTLAFPPPQVLDQIRSSMWSLTALEVNEEAEIDDLTLDDLQWTLVSCDNVTHTLPLCETDSLTSSPMDESTGLKIIH